MKINFNKLLRKYSGLSFFLLFPGFFFYQVLIGLDMIKPILGGYFGIVAISLLPVFGFLFFIVQVAGNYEICLFDGIFYVLMAVVFFISCANYFADLPEGYANDMFVWSMSGFVFMSICYFIAKSVPLHSNFFTLILFLSLAIMSMCVFLNIGSRGIFYLKGVSSNVEFVVSYQGFARSLSVVSLLLLSILKDKKIMLLVFLVSFTALFFNGARTEFGLFLVSTAISVLYFNVLSIKKMVFLSLSFVISSVMLLLLLFSDGLNFLPSSRMFELQNIFESTSYQARNEMLIYGLDVIGHNPFLGDYGSYTILGGFGYYPHNLISAWVNLGIVGFSLYLIAFILLAFVLLSNVRSCFNPVELRTLLLFSVFTILALIVSKDYSYMLVGFMFGFCSRFLLLKQVVRRRAELV